MAGGFTPWLDLNVCPEPEETGSQQAPEAENRERSGDCSCSGSTTSLESTSPSIVFKSGARSHEPRRRSLRSREAGQGNESAAVGGEEPMCRDRRHQRDAFEEECCNSSRNEKIFLSNSSKKRKVAALHKFSARMRRDKFSQKIKILKKIVPCSSKDDMVSILDGAIDHLKQLQAQHRMLSSLRNSYQTTALLQQSLVPATMATWPVHQNQLGSLNMHLSPPIIFFPSFYPSPACDAHGNSTSSTGFVYPSNFPFIGNTNQAEVRC